VFAFPGVWTRYKGPLKKNGENVKQEVFAFMKLEAPPERSERGFFVCRRRKSTGRQGQ